MRPRDLSDGRPITVALTQLPTNARIPAHARLHQSAQHQSTLYQSWQDLTQVHVDIGRAGDVGIAWGVGI